MSRIIEVKTENGIELKTLFEVLKDVLHETTIQFIKGDDKSTNKENENGEESENTSEESSESEEDSKSKKGKKGKKEKPKKKPIKKEVKKDAKDVKDAKDTKDEKKQSKGGMKVLTIDEQQTLILYVKLASENFLKFNCKYDRYDIGVDLGQLYGFLKTIDREGILTIHIDDDEPQKIIFDVENDGKSTQFKLKLMDSNQKDHPIAPPVFDIMVTMSTAEFHKVCRELSGVSTFMGVTCSNKRIEFKSEGDSSELIKTYDNGKDVKIQKYKKTDDTPCIVKEIYELKYLNMFSKCTNLCQDIQIFLANEYPMFIRYTVASLGEMTIGISPVDEKAYNKTLDYDEENDQYYDNEDKVKMKN